MCKGFYKMKAGMQNNKNTTLLAADTSKYPKPALCHTLTLQGEQWNVLFLPNVELIPF